MNPDKPSREDIEIQLTALLLGELPAEEAQSLRAVLAQDPDLQKLHDELQSTISLVREVVNAPVETDTTLKLSDERRQKLLAQFQTSKKQAVPPKSDPLFWLKRIDMSRIQAPRLLTVLAVLAIVALLAAMMLPSLAAAKKKAQKVSVANVAKQRALEEQMREADEKASLPMLTATTVPATPPESVTVATAPMMAPPPATIVLPSGGSPAETPAKPAELASAGSVQEALRQPGVSSATAASAEQERQLISGERKRELKPTDSLAVNADDKSLIYNRTLDEQAKFAEALKEHQAQTQTRLASVEKPMQATTDSFNTPWAGGSGGGGGGAGSFQFKTDSTPQNRGEIFALSDANGKLGAASNSGEEYRRAGAATQSVMDPQTSLPTSGLVSHGSNTWQDTTVAYGLTERQTQMRATELTTAINGVDFEQGASALTANKDNASVAGDIPISDKLFQSQNNASTLSGAVASNSAQNRGAVAGVVNAFPGSGSLRSYGDADRDDGGLRYVTKVARDSKVSAAARSYITNLGVDLNQPGKSVFYNDRLGKLFVKGTAEDIAKIEKALSADSLSSTKAKQDARGINFAISTNNVVFSEVKSPAGASAIDLSSTTATIEDKPLHKLSPAAPIPQPEYLCRENNFSTFSLNVSDVSFKLAAASLERGQLPEAASIRSEEFINAFDYRDPEAKAGQPLAFTAERARYPFAHNRDLLRFSVKTAAAGRAEGRALNLVLLLDNSGSMERADRVAIIREALRVLGTQLQAQDTVSVVTFARTARLWADGVKGSQASETLQRVSGITPEGGTNLEEAMRLAYETAHHHYLANGMNRVVLITDGAANLGNVDASALNASVEAQRKQGIALDCFGVGFEDYNDDLLQQLSSNGDGRYAFLNSTDDASKEFAAKLAGALQVAAQDVKVQVEFNPQRVVSWRQIGYAKHQLKKEQFRDNTVDAAEIAAQEAGNALYTVETKADGIGPIATVRVRYKVPGTSDYRERSWDVPYEGAAPALEQASPAMRLAATAGAFSEWLTASPFAQQVTLEDLQKILRGVPQVYGADKRPQQLETMLREAKSIAGQ